jgi:hypothetical protein
MTEAEAQGIGFHIDHYLPQRNHPNLKSKYSNLMWSCQKCNNYKSDYDPSEEKQKEGKYILRPDSENPIKHYELDGIRLKSKTFTGEFNIEWLELNRKMLRELRRIRERFCNANDYILSGIQQIVNIKLDQIAPNKRVIFNKIRKRLLEQKFRHFESIEEILKEFAKSKLLDEDQDLKPRTKNRKKYLKETKAISYGLE